MDLTREQQDRLIIILRHRLGIGIYRIGRMLGLSKCAIECRYYKLMGTTRQRVEAAKEASRYDRFCRMGKLSTGSSGLSRPDKAQPVEKARIGETIAA